MDRYHGEHRALEAASRRRMPQRNGIAHVHAEVLGRLLGYHQARRVGAERAAHRRRAPQRGVEVDDLYERVYLLLAVAQRAYEAQPGLLARQRSCAQHRRHLLRVDRIDVVQVYLEPVGAVAQYLPLAAVYRRDERVDHSHDADQHRDDRGDSEQRQQAAARRAKQVAERHPDDAAPRHRQALQQRRQAASSRGKMPGAYGVHGGDAHGPPYRVRYRGEGQQEPGRGHAREQPELERRLPHRERQERGQHSSHELADQQPHADAEHHPQERDLRANQQRPERHPGRRRAQRHRHADLTPLGLDHAAGQVERRKGGAQEQGGAEDVPELPVALRVLCDGQVRKVVLGDHDRDAEVVERLLQLI